MLADWTMDVPCPVDVVLGTTVLRVRDCAQLGPDSVIRLRQPAGADLEIHAAGVPIAAGEVVIADEGVTLRVTRILPPAPRGPLA
jgi:flagellar motor switch/type III secretory pathway protein FliN